MALVGFSNQMCILYILPSVLTEFSCFQIISRLIQELLPLPELSTMPCPTHSMQEWFPTQTSHLMFPVWDLQQNKDTLNRKLDV